LSKISTNVGKKDLPKGLQHIIMNFRLLIIKFIIILLLRKQLKIIKRLILKEKLYAIYKE
jgi:hypothetical protein